MHIGPSWLATDLISFSQLMPFWLVIRGIDTKIEEKKSDTVWLVPDVSAESE